jgi:hypothetical protein
MLIIKLDDLFKFGSFIFRANLSLFTCCICDVIESKSYDKP